MADNHTHADALEKAEAKLQQSAAELEATVESVEREVSDYNDQLDKAKMAQEIMVPLAKAEK